MYLHLKRDIGRSNRMSTYKYCDKCRLKNLHEVPCVHKNFTLLVFSSNLFRAVKPSEVLLVALIGKFASTI